MVAISNRTQAAIGYVHPLNIAFLFHRSVNDAVREFGYPEISVMSGPNVARARNKVCENFLDQHGGIDWLFMVDTDMVFNTQCIIGLMASDEPLISALCLTGGEKPTPSMYNRVEEGRDKGWYLPITEWETDAIIDADVVGSACLLIHRSVLEDIRTQTPNPAAHWFQEEQAGDVLLGEDFTFCERAARVGYKTKVNTSIQVGHVKGTLLGTVK